MCRLLGFISEKPAPLGYYMLHAPVPFRSFGDKRNPDGWGLGWYECNVPMFFKELRPAPHTRLLPLVTAGTVTNLAIAHVRKASQGSLCRLNCHPFVYEKWLFAHNGTIRNAAELAVRTLTRRHRRAITGGTDSEIYFHLLLQAIERRKGDVTAGIRDVTASLHDFTSANFLLADSHCLYAYRNATQRTRHFSLFYRSVERSRRLPFATAATVPHDVRDVAHVVVCSNRLTTGRWHPVPLRHLLKVERGVPPELIKLHA